MNITYQSLWVNAVYFYYQPKNKKPRNSLRGLCYIELVYSTLFFSVTRPANSKVTNRTPTVLCLYV
jgi:hypothetical protein